jgi:hypothetical protein
MVLQEGLVQMVVKEVLWVKVVVVVVARVIRPATGHLQTHRLTPALVL